MPNKKQSERDEFIAKLRKDLKPGDTLSTVLRHVSSSGMSRVIDVYHLKAVRGKVVKSWLSYWIAKACDYSFQDKRGQSEGIKVGGCGMDMGFEIVYTLGRVLYPKGYGCIGANCHSNDHSNGDLSRAKHARKAPHWHNDGGYALNHEWI